MASFRGEIRHTHQGQAYHLVLDWDALCVFEDLTGLSFPDLADQIRAGKLTAKSARALVAAAGVAHHSEDMTLGLAGAMLSEDFELAVRLVEAASPAPADQERLKN